MNETHMNHKTSSTFTVFMPSQWLPLQRLMVVKASNLDEEDVPVHLPLCS